MNDALFGSKLTAALRRLLEIDQESVLAITDIAEERVRQIDSEGWSPQHDDEHSDGEMADAAACYAVGSTMENEVPRFWDGLPTRLKRRTTVWPWSPEWWKPKSPHHNKVRAAALLVAELARIQRRATRAAGGA